LSYSFTADLISATTGQMNAALPPTPDYVAFTELPPDLPEDFEREAEQVTTPGQSMFGKARAIEDWFRTEFDYNLEAAATPGENIDDLVEFLVNDREGYCEQFASAMAIMARTLNIPSRVAIGFLEPQQIDDDTWEFRGTDMHAWPELHFEGAGWVRFEPTPDTEQSEGAQPLDFVPGPPNTDPTAPTGPTDDLTGRSQGERLDQPSGAAADDENAGAGGGSDIWWIGPVALFGLAFFLSLPRLTRAFVRRRRWSRAQGSDQAAEAAWAELRDHVVDLRMAWDAGATPRAIGRSLRERLPDDRTGRSDIVPALNQLVLAIEQARYARSIREADGLRDAQVTVAEALSSRQTPGRRFLARWLPASLVRSRRRTAVRSERLGELLVSIED
jgi:transglutaminase-like putative cysteine protease